MIKMKQMKELDRLQNGEVSRPTAFSLTEVFSTFHAWSVSCEAFVVTLLLSLPLLPLTSWPPFVHIITYLVILAPNLHHLHPLTSSLVPKFYWFYHENLSKVHLLFCVLFSLLQPLIIFCLSHSKIVALNPILVSSMSFSWLLLTLRLILVKWNSISLDLNL